MNKKILLSLGAVAAVMLTAGLFLHLGNDSDRSTDAALQGCRWGAEPDKRLSYELVWSTSHRRRMGAAQPDAPWMRAGTELGATLVVQASNEAQCSAWVSLAKISGATSTVHGQTLPVSREELSSGRALARWNASGALLDLSFAAETPASVQNMLNSLLTELQIQLPDPGQMRTARGVVQTQTRGADLKWIRTKLSYSELSGLQAAAGRHEVTGKGTIALRPDGTIDRLADEEHLSIFDAEGRQLLESTQSLGLRYQGTTSAPVITHRPLALRRPAGQTVVDEAARREALEARAGGLTGVQLIADVRAFDGDKPPNDAFMWQATGRLLAQPELSDDLAEVVSLPMVSHATRELALDVLAHTGHPEAQAAMRRALSSEAVRADDAARVLLLQRFSFVKSPVPETVAYLREHYDGALSDNAEARRAATYSLGSVAGHLADRGENERAKDIVARLLADLSQAAAQSDAMAIIAGLGNAHDEAAVEVLLNQSFSGRAPVRGASATALRHFTDEAVTLRLVELVADPSATVQRSALGALRGRPLGAQTFGILRDQVKEGRTDSLNDALLVGTVADHRQRPEIREVLTFILSRSTGDSRLRGRIRNMLDRRR